MSNQIDEIYNKFVAEEKLKTGTKYEKLAALVYKSLYTDQVVIHDMRLRGIGKSTKHQIDVTIMKEGNKKRILVECKDYDKVIGLGIVRDFFGAISQLNPEEAIVVTKVGFTKGAISFAKDENIKLAILREFEEEDWENRVRKLMLNLDLIILDTPKITGWDIVNKENLNELKNKIQSNEVISIKTYETYFYTNGGTIEEDFQSVFAPIFNSIPCQPGIVCKGNYSFDRNRYIRLAENLVEVQGFSYELTCHTLTQTYEFDEVERLAILLIRMLDGTIDKAIFDDEIDKWTFDENGVVVSENK